MFDQRDHSSPVSSYGSAFGSGPEPVPPPKRGPGFLRRFFNLLLLLIVLSIIGGIIWGALSFTGSRSDVPAGKKVTVQIPSGATSATIATVLADAGVVRNSSIFRARLRMRGDGTEFRSGTYTMRAGSSYDTIVRTLNAGPPAAPTFTLTIPEGQRLEEVAATLDRIRSESIKTAGQKPLPRFTGAEYLKAVKKLKLPQNAQAPAGTKSLEGFLFPATYELKLAATADEFVQKQRAAFDDNMASINTARAKKANLTVYDLVIIASLIEREARLEKERPLVSAVIWNRLKIGEPLYIDASNQYDVYQAGSKDFWAKELTKSDLARESPYNLRKVQGLPPTPIASPGLSSLKAAANPAKVDYRYYVANPDGSGEHFFTESFDEFQRHPFQQG